MSDFYGQVVDGVCVNVVVADAEWVGLLEGEWILSTTTNVAWIGATVTDEIFQVIPRAEHLTDTYASIGDIYDAVSDTFTPHERKTLDETE